MKETKALETQLHSWQPRRPSAALEGRLFATRVSRMPQMALLVGWLVPATACALLTFSVVSSGTNIPGQLSRQEPTVATLLSDPNYLGSAPDGFQKGQNDLSSVTFDWTNRSGCTSSMFSLPRSRVN